VEYHYDNLFEELNMLQLHISHCHLDASFLMKVALNVAPLTSKHSAFVFLLGACGTSPRSVVPAATALQVGVLQLLMEFVNLQIFAETPVYT
jgi:hypothetical protein